MPYGPAGAVLGALQASFESTPPGRHRLSIRCVAPSAPAPAVFCIVLCATATCNTLVSSDTEEFQDRKLHLRDIDAPA